MFSRGPDAFGTILQGNACFGHRRLKIIYLSLKSRQPISDPFLGLDIVFNGCIYNYRELRSDLEEEGYHFFRRVIPKSY